MLGESCSQNEVFSNCSLDVRKEIFKKYNNEIFKSLLFSALDGYSATLFAYGQTGSGKTYTCDLFILFKKSIYMICFLVWLE